MTQVAPRKTATALGKMWSRQPLEKGVCTAVWLSRVKNGYSFANRSTNGTRLPSRREELHVSLPLFKTRNLKRAQKPRQPPRRETKKSKTFVKRRKQTQRRVLSIHLSRWFGQVRQRAGRVVLLYPLPSDPDETEATAHPKASATQPY